MLHWIAPKSPKWHKAKLIKYRHQNYWLENRWDKAVLITICKIEIMKLTYLLEILYVKKILRLSDTRLLSMTDFINYIAQTESNMNSLYKCLFLWSSSRKSQYFCPSTSCLVKVEKSRTPQNYKNKAQQYHEVLLMIGKLNNFNYILFQVLIFTLCVIYIENDLSVALMYSLLLMDLDPFITLLCNSVSAGFLDYKFWLI